MGVKCMLDTFSINYLCVFERFRESKREREWEWVSEILYVHKDIKYLFYSQSEDERKTDKVAKKKEYLYRLRYLPTQNRNLFACALNYSFSVLGRRKTQKHNDLYIIDVGIYMLYTWIKYYMCIYISSSRDTRWWRARENNFFLPVIFENYFFVRDTSRTRKTRGFWKRIASLFVDRMVKKKKKRIKSQK